MAHKRTVKPGELFLLKDGSAIRNCSWQKVDLVLLSEQEVEQLGSSKSESKKDNNNVTESETK